MFNIQSKVIRNGGWTTKIKEWKILNLKSKGWKKWINSSLVDIEQL